MPHPPSPPASPPARPRRAPALPAALPPLLRPDGRLADEVRAAVAPGGHCDGARLALALLGAVLAAARGGAAGPALRDLAGAFVREALAVGHDAAVADDYAARAAGAVELLQLLHGARGCAADAGLLADLAAMLERPPLA
jgi:hypothetical protein